MVGLVLCEDGLDGVLEEVTVIGLEKGFGPYEVARKGM